MLTWGLDSPWPIWPCSPAMTCEAHRWHPPVVQCYPGVDCVQIAAVYLKTECPSSRELDASLYQPLLPHPGPPQEVPILGRSGLIALIALLHVPFCVNCVMGAPVIAVIVEWLGKRKGDARHWVPWARGSVACG